MDAVWWVQKKWEMFGRGIWDLFGRRLINCLENRMNITIKIKGLKLWANIYLFDCILFFVRTPKDQEFDDELLLFDLQIE